jgi:hypothetical protein
MNPRGPSKKVADAAIIASPNRMQRISATWLTDPARQSLPTRKETAGGQHVGYAPVMLWNP